MSFISRAAAKIAGHFTHPHGGKLPSIYGASADNYLRNLRVLQTSLRATAAGQISPVLTANVAKILTEHGMGTDELGKALAGGALTIPAFEATSAAGAVANELSDFQTAVAQAKAGVPRAPSASSSALVGAAQGFATGGPIGAIAGAVGGFIGGRQGQRTAATLKKAVADAERLASPENFAANLAKVTQAAREETFVSGQQAGLAEEAAVSKSGLRGTGIGTQASIAASVAPEIAALRRSISQAAGITGNEVSARLGTPVRPAKTTLVDVLGAAAGVAGALLTPEAAARRRQSRIPITGGASYTDTLGSNIYQPTVSDIGR